MKTQLLILSAALLLLFSACKEENDTSCPGNPDDYNVTYHLRADTSFLPYTGRDTLYFQVADSNGLVKDTVVFYGQGKSYDRAYLEANNVNGCDYKYYGQNYAVKYYSPDLPQTIDMSFQTTKSSSSISVTFGTDNYSYTPSLLNGSAGFKYASKDIAGQNYSNIIQVCSSRLVGAAECDKHPLLANKTQGILVIDTKGYIVLNRLY